MSKNNIAVLTPYPVDKAYDYKALDGVSAQAGDYLCVPLGNREVPAVAWGEAANDIAPGAAPGALSEISRQLLILIALTAILVPLLWIAFAAFRTPEDLTVPGSFVINPTLENLREVIGGDIPGATLRSFIVGISVTIVGLLVGSMAGYSIARFRTGGIGLRFAILFPTIIPPTVLAFPLLALALNLNITDSLFAVIAAHLTIVVPMITWFMTGFFAGVPREIEEQAAIDGYGPFKAFLIVVIPNVLPGLGASALLAFMLS